jgi:hypothetical protein
MGALRPEWLERFTAEDTVDEMSDDAAAVMSERGV